jgi:lipopolysaccharide/colanic/teichoic acid biosynthesis glycosyltransferase
MLETIRACENASVDIHVLPRFFELGVAVDGKDVDDVWGIPLVRLRRSLRSRCSRVSKRVVDVSLASLGLAVSAPIYGLLALAVKVSSPGPVYFRQKRVGQHGVLVDVLKFRTMRVHDGADVEWTADGDHVTKVGHLMRRLSLDELPQLWSVIRGHMSLVGPRPERPFFVERFKSQVPHYDARHRVPVGLTGLAQVHGLRGDTPIDERARFDNRYIESWSLWRDLVIIFMTLFAIVRDAIPSSSDGDEVATQTAIVNAVEDERCDPQPEVVVSATRPRPSANPWYLAGSDWDQVASAG